MNFDEFNPNLEIEAASTLPASWYISAEVERLERERIFRRSWQCVGLAEWVADRGTYFATEVGGEPVLVVRDESGALRAMSNVCRHRASTLASGRGSLKRIRCPYHAWTYDLTGRLIGQPEFQGARDWERERICLPAFAVETWGPLLFVKAGSGGESLHRILGPIPEQMAKAGFALEDYRFVVRREYDIRCNWKTYVDNYLEGYHIPSVHPALFQEVDYNAYRVDTFGLGCSHHAPFRSPAGKAGERRYGEEAGKVDALYYWVFPNFMINIYPDMMHTSLVLPLGPERTVTIFEWFTSSRWQGSAADIESAIAFNERTQKEDMEICERVQKGLNSSTYHQGRFSPKRENGVYHFHRLVHRFLTPPELAREDGRGWPVNRPVPV